MSREGGRKQEEVQPAGAECAHAGAAGHGDGDVPAFAKDVRRSIDEQLVSLRDELEKQYSEHVADVKSAALKDLVLLSDRITVCSRDAIAMFKGLDCECLEVLARAGLSPIRAESHDFDPSAQRVAKTEETDRKELDGKVARVLRRGFRDESGRVVRPQDVVAYRLRKECGHEQ